MGRKSHKKALGLFVLLFIFSVIIVVGVYQSMQQPRKKSAAEYFEIFDASVLDGEFREPTIDQGGSYENSSVLIVYGVVFKLKAVGGDAHSVIVKSWAGAPPEELGDIAMNQMRDVEQMSSRPQGYLSMKDESGGFPFPVKIWSLEAEGTIIIYPR